MTELEQLKAKYPLAFDTIKLPVRYDDNCGQIDDGSGNGIVDILLLEPDTHDRIMERQDQIGELIAHLLNQLE